MSGKQRLQRINNRARELAERADHFTSGFQLLETRKKLQESGEWEFNEDETLHMAIAQEAEEHWNAITQSQVNAQPSTGLAGSTNPNRAILETRLRHYKAEIAALEESSLTVQQPSVAEIKYQVIKETEENIESFKTLLRLQREERQELKEKIVKLEELIGHQVTLSDALAQKLETQSSQPVSSDGNTSQEMKQNVKTMGKENRRLMGLMASFMKQYFPSPNQPKEDDNKKRKSGGKSIAEYFGTSETEVITLNEFLEDLMNACISSPHDPYVTLSSKHWQPYVELIVRSGIGSLHPQHANKMKLTEYHS